jgi:hypothetical protein
MTNIRERQFEFEGRKLTVRAVSLAEGWKVRVFEGSTAVTGIVYEVKHEVAVDALTKEVPVDLIEHLMAIAEGDVTRKWVRVTPKR